MTVSLIISTYNAPVALRRTLEGVAGLTEYPHEVIVADDGSTEETAEVVRKFAASAPFAVKHVWHEDKGFRLGAIRNKAIAAAEGDYIVQIDGDILLHPRFVEDHRRYARRGAFACGSRVLLGERLTNEIFRNGIRKITPLTSGILNRKNALRSPLLASVVGSIASGRLKYRGCNMAFWRDDLVAVNGYDENYSGWGCEDHDLVARLINNGVRFLPLRHVAVCYHMWHPSSKEAESFDRNNRLLAETRQSGRIRCENGLDNYLKAGK